MRRLRRRRWRISSGDRCEKAIVPVLCAAVPPPATFRGELRWQVKRQYLMLPRSPHDVSGQAWMFASLAVRMLRLSPHIMSGQVGPSPVPDVFFGLYTCCRDVFFFFGVETGFSTLPVRA